MPDHVNHIPSQGKIIKRKISSSIYFGKITPYLLMPITTLINNVLFVTSVNKDRFNLEIKIYLGSRGRLNFVVLHFGFLDLTDVVGVGVISASHVMVHNPMPKMIVFLSVAFFVVII